MSEVAIQMSHIDNNGIGSVPWVYSAPLSAQVFVPLQLPRRNRNSLSEMPVLI